MRCWDEITKVQHVTEGDCLHEVFFKTVAARLCEYLKPRHLVEVGFNAGRSACLWLNHVSREAQVVSCDIGNHPYVWDAWAILHREFPNFTLLLGDSTNTLKQLRLSHPADLVFVDGGHLTDICLSDVRNMVPLLSPSNGVLIVDDSEIVSVGKALDILRLSGELRRQGLTEQQVTFPKGARKFTVFAKRELPGRLFEVVA